MATTGSSLEMLSAFIGFISSYLALMRGISPVTQSKASFFLFGGDVSLIKLNPLIHSGI
jgi:hypothetical protein